MSRGTISTARLLRLGAAAAQRSEARQLRFAAVFLATLILALSLIALVAAQATYEGQRQRGLDRSPVFIDGVGAGKPSKVLYAEVGDVLPGVRPYTVVFLTPLVSDAPLPPGLAAWPSPGQAALSPALLSQASNLDVRRRYGTVVRTLGEEGLQSPDELFAYVVPLKPLKENITARPIIGFGPMAGPVYRFSGQTDYDKPLWLFIGMVTCLVVAPAAVLAIVAVRTGSHRRDRRVGLIAALGGTPRQRALITLGEAVVPVAAGSLTAAGIAGTASLTDVVVPWTGHVLVASDLRLRWWAWVIAILAAVASIVVALLITNKARLADGAQHRGTGLQDTSHGVSRWAMAFPLMLLLATRGPDVFEPGTSMFVLMNWSGVIGCVATLPAAVAMSMRGIGRTLAKSGRRHGAPSILVAGCRLAFHPGPVARMTSGVAVAIVVVLQVAAWQGQVGGPARAAEQTAHRIGSSMLLVAPRGADADTTARFFESLPPTMVHLVAELSPERQSVTLSGDCVSLAVVHIECSKVKVLVTERPGDPRMQAVVGLNRLYVETVESLAFTENGMVTHLLVSGDGSDLPESEIARLAYREFSLGADVGVVGASWLGGAMVNQLQGEWLTLFGTLGVGTLGVAVLLSGLAEFLRLGRSIAPLAVLAGNRSIYWLVSVFALFLPILIAGIAGSVVGLWVALPQTKGGQGLISDQTVLACGTAALTVALVGWIWGAITAVKQADAWRSRDE